MGHKYVKEEDTFSTSQNGTVPKPTAQDISDGKVLSASGTWVANSGGGTLPKKYIILSDSYGNEFNSSNKNFIDVARSYLGYDSTQFIDCHRASAGFSQSGDLSFLAMLQNVSVDRTTVTDIVVFAGANDIGASNYNSVNSGIADFMTWVKANMPNAKVAIGHIGIIFNKADMWNRLVNSLAAYRRCCVYGATYIKNSEYILNINSFLKTDHVHPVSGVVDFLGQHLTDAINNGCVDIHLYDSGNPVVNTSMWSVCSYSAGTSYAYINNNSFTIGGLNDGLIVKIVINPSWIPTVTTWTHIFALHDSPFIGTPNNMLFIRSKAVIKDSNGTIYEKTCKLLIDGDRDSSNRVYVTPIFDSLSDVANIVEVSFYGCGETYPVDL